MSIMIVPQMYELWAPVWEFPDDAPEGWGFRPWTGPMGDGRREWRRGFAAKTDIELADELDDWVSICRVIAWHLLPTSEARVGASVIAAIAAGGDADWDFTANTAEECREIVLARFRAERDRVAAELIGS